MTIVPPGSTVLVTGANGYIAAWIVRTLLEEGYRVRGTVRTRDKGRALQKIFEKFETKFEFVVVPDITKDGAFDEAVQDVDAIAHAASPVNFSTEDPQDLIRPAVRGTESILQSASQAGSKVRRIVYTSSVAAILEVDPKPRTFTEENWNNQSVALIRTL
ncbi:NAD(P)-binding protein [Lentinula raphanica]|uniref:NAD(P)-binding protein n=1 Tax=Lentinula raphanica TaxID=153919 RepID=A0AA38PE83_9AGAR|nr:NAD(P)-binding protein [Lentinula raphanica]